MKLVDFLQGKWLGHPLHPALVHVPVGAWIGACLLDLAARTAGPSAPAAWLALYLVAAGLFVAFLAVPTGIADWSGIKKEKPAWKLGLYHLVLNAVAALIWCGNFGLRLGALQSTEPITTPILITSVAGALLVAGGGYLGKLMVYDHGISVARASKKKWRAIAERGGANVPPAP